MKKLYSAICLIVFLLSVNFLLIKNDDNKMTIDDGNWFFLKTDDLQEGEHHLKHGEIFGKYVEGYNKYILSAIDEVQKTALDGGGYFIGIKAVPTESPIGYDLKLLGKKLISAPRTTSYCSGASYTVFVESLNLMYSCKNKTMPEENYEAMRMQEPDGSRREDNVKFWGKWNADGFGTQFALVQYSKIGKKISPQNARPGDFVNISWKSGLGHSVVFLGWNIDEKNDTNLVYFSSQPVTNGFGDVSVNVNRIKEVLFVRLSEPDGIFVNKFEENIDYKVKGDIIKFN